jgi:hypothetical protein
MSLSRSGLGLSGVSGGVGTSLLGVGGCGSGSRRSSGRSAGLGVSSIAVLWLWVLTDRGIVIDLVWVKSVVVRVSDTSRCICSES